MGFGQLRFSSLLNTVGGIATEYVFFVVVVVCLFVFFFFSCSLTITEWWSFGVKVSMEVYCSCFIGSFQLEQALTTLISGKVIHDCFWVVHPL